MPELRSAFCASPSPLTTGYTRPNEWWTPRIIHQPFTKEHIRDYGANVNTPVSTSLHHTRHTAATSVSVSIRSTTIITMIGQLSLLFFTLPPTNSNSSFSLIFYFYVYSNNFYLAF